MPSASTDAPLPLKTCSPQPVRVLRIITRLNMGGPAKHVAILSGNRMRERGYETLLVHGSLAIGEDSLVEEARTEGASMTQIPSLVQPIEPLLDLKAARSLSRILQDFQPDLVHTHTAKAGLIGRAVAMSQVRRPTIVHTYHGHVLEGYFGPLKNATFRVLERLLAVKSDQLIAVSQATADDLIRFGVAKQDAFCVVPLGLELTPLVELPPHADMTVRKRLGLPDEGFLLLFIGRLTRVKRVDLLLRALEVANRRGCEVHLAIVGDGELRPELEDLARQLGIDRLVHFLGYREDVIGPIAAADAAILSSGNEGTPVSLIEAAAGGRPAIATDVGGVRDVVTPESGFVVPPGDPNVLADEICRLAGDKALAQSLGLAARQHAEQTFAADRLVEDIDLLYRELLNRPEQLAP